MRKSDIYIGVGLTAVVAAVLALVIALRSPEGTLEEMLTAYQAGAKYDKLTIAYPLNETLFPPDIAPATFRWTDSNGKCDRWAVTIKFQSALAPMSFLTDQPRWTPQIEDWQTIKKRSLEKQAQVTILGVNRRAARKILSAASIVISTSKDQVGAPIFYRDVNLPFIDAVKDPSRIRWRFGAISSTQRPPIVLENLPVCGNCHSFSADGSVLGMDIDYANDKGSYALTQVSKEMVLDKDCIITWNDYARSEKEITFGLLSQVSPDGKVAVSTVKDWSVFVPKAGLEFSQLFFPLKGILGVYSRQDKTFRALPGADDPQYVQSNPTWSPNGKYIVFARSKAYQLTSIDGAGRLGLSERECNAFVKEGKPFKFDLYRILYNDGKGGEPEPLAGASNNGMSNYFARYSPDGKWIVFCKAANYMLLQPDSQLYIIPAGGGQARRLRCNTNRMNSWHSWSPNGKWVVFSSKANGPYTQLFLTHIDEQGRSSPPVLLSQFTAADRAANIPEFVNAAPDAIRRIREGFVDEYSYVRVGREALNTGDVARAIREYRKALAINPNSTEVHCALGWAMLKENNTDEAVRYYHQALQLDPNCADAHAHMGTLLLMNRTFLERATEHLLAAARLEPQNPAVHFNLGIAMFRHKNYHKAIELNTKALELRPKYVLALIHLGASYAELGRFTEAICVTEKAIDIARADGKEDIVRHARKRMEFYRGGTPYRPSRSP